LFLYKNVSKGIQFLVKYSLKIRTYLIQIRVYLEIIFLSLEVKTFELISGSSLLEITVFEVIKQSSKLSTDPIICKIFNPITIYDIN